MDYSLRLANPKRWFCLSKWWSICLFYGWCSDWATANSIGNFLVTLLGTATIPIFKRRSWTYLIDQYRDYIHKLLKSTQNLSCYSYISFHDWDLLWKWPLKFWWRKNLLVVRVVAKNFQGQNTTSLILLYLWGIWTDGQEHYIGSAI
jgi:hypothetical protein